LATGKDLAILTRLEVHPDSRGSVRETYRASWFPMVPPVKQLVRSESKPKTLRGLHLHKRQWDIWHFVSGSALVRLRYDDGDEWYQRMDAGQALAIPPNVSHGFYTEEGCVLLYALTEEYTGDDEFGWYPFDGLTEDSHPGWPRDHIGLIVSERDLRAPRLAEFAP
jgi:dTDP-4-dehydrorhamnose 3,5-epimerase-like enzyme